ncbi:MAG: hypothetical protein JXA60_12790 [Candidatus Coatesbacteria bacterium]|nr:hypothetical protein [Candidatus Coatesbacteria bacterium]
MKKMLILFYVIVLSSFSSAFEPGDFVASFPMPYEQSEEQPCTGLAYVQGKLYACLFYKGEIWRADANTGTWEAKFIVSFEDRPYDIGLSFSGDTMAVVGNGTKTLYFVDAHNPSTLYGACLLDESVVEEANPPYITGCTYISTNYGYELWVVDRDNYKFYTIDAKNMVFKNKFDVPLDLAKPWWLRGLDWDINIQSLLLVVSCFDETASQLDSAFLRAMDQNNFTQKKELPSEGQFVFFGYNMRGIAYNSNFYNNQTECNSVYYMSELTTAYDRQYAWILASFGTTVNVKNDTWGGIKKMFGSKTMSRPILSTKTASKAKKHVKSRLFLPRRFSAI